jgi:hypothetical protein
MSERKPRQRHAKNHEIGDWTQFLPAPAQQNPIADEEVEFRQAVSARLDILRAAKLENLAREFQRLRDVFLGPETQRQRVRTRAAATTIILGLAQNGWERAILEYLLVQPPDPKTGKSARGNPGQNVADDAQLLIAFAMFKLWKPESTRRDFVIWWRDNTVAGAENRGLSDTDPDKRKATFDAFLLGLDRARKRERKRRKDAGIVPIAL